MRFEIVKIGSRVALSIVACGMLCEGTNYANWNGGSFQGGDTVNISFQDDPSRPSVQQPILNNSITLASGTLTATVNIASSKSTCGIVACLSGQTTFGSTGASLIFNVTGGTLPSNPSAFDIKNGGSLTVDANIKVSGTIPTKIFNVAGNGNLTFNGDVELSGAGTAIAMNGGSLEINKNGNQKVSITGAITANGGNTTIKLDAQDKITGTFNGTNNSNLDLTIDNSTYTGNVTNNGTSKITIQNNGSLAGNLSTSGTSLNLTMNNGSITQGVTSTATTNSVTMNGGNIGGKLTTNGNGTNTINLSNSATIAGGFDANGTTTLTMNNSTINGTSTISGNSLTINTSKQANFQGSLTSTATTNDLKLLGTAVSGDLTLKGNANKLIVNGSTLSKQLIIGNSNTSTNTINTESSAKINGGIQAQGNTTLAMNSGTISGTSTISGQNFTATLNNSNGKTSTIETITSSATTNTLTLSGASQITNGINTNSPASTVTITLSDTSKINGTSNLHATTTNHITMKNTSSGGTFNLHGPSNTLTASGTDNTLTGLTMQGTNGGNATNNILNATGKLTINGNATLTAGTGGNNNIDFKDGGITGTLTTSGATTLDTKNSTSIGAGIHHSNGNFTANFKDASQVNGGIQTSGTGNANVTFNNTSSLKGNSSFASANNTLTLDNTSTIQGNTSFSNTSTLTANNGTTITGQIITAGGTATYTFGNNNGGGATVAGGIDTNQGAGKTTATFNNSSKLQNGTSTFHSDIDITFANNSQAINETFNVQAGTANITFKDNAEMQGGSINNNGGTANILFQDNSKMINNGLINTANGTTKLDAKNSANLTGSITQSGGTFTANFNDNSQFNGNATQTGGTSNITFQNQAKWTGDFTQTGGGSNSTITFHGNANMKGNITTNNGKTNITFDQRAWIKGNIAAQGSNNNVTFDNSLLNGNLTLDGFGNIMGHSTGNFTSSRITGNVTGYDKVNFTLQTSEILGKIYQGPSANNSGMAGNFTDSKVHGGFKGKNSINNLTLSNSEIDKGVAQDGGKLTLTSNQSIITGGFSGTSNSKNTVTMNKGSLTGGISQNTGSLDFLSQGTNIEGGFKGVNSSNTLKMANGNFNNGNIVQEGGSLQAEIIAMTGVNNFNGTNSQNNINLLQTEINDAIQSGGSLDLLTYSNVKGSIRGTNNSQNKIQAIGSTISNDITQNTGSMELYLTNSNAGTQTNNKIGITNATFGLYANSSTVKNIELSNSTGTGISSDLTLTGTFTQTNGRSTMTFADSKFQSQNSINLTDTTSASLIFTKSEIQNVQATRGTSTLNLSDSKMGNFTGTNGNHTVMLTTSTGRDFSQSGGSLAVSGAATSTITSLAGTNSANITLNLNATSKVTGNVTNQNGNTSISLQNSTIGGSVEQTGGNLTFTADRSEVTGHYKQTGGGTSVNFSHSSIKGGVDLSTVTAGSTLTFSQGSEVDQGFKVANSTISLSLLSKSKITGGFSQTGGNVTGSLDDSSISGNGNTAGLALSGGTTNFTLYNNSKIENGITATDNTTTILVDNSQINGDITIERGSLDLTAQNKSTITSAQMKVTNADLKLTLDTNSTFTGNLEQTNNNQTIIIKQGSTFDGSITNNNTTGTITITNATLTGSISQTNGTLGLDLSNGGKIGQDVTLTGANTTLSGSGNGNEIRGNFSQSNGTLTGSMNGLTLKGTYTQNGGTSDVSFTNSAFNSNTTITTATSSSLTFDNSTLKSYTISGGNNNTLKLLNGSEMTGDLTLQNQATATLKMQDSKIDGNISATDNSFLNFNTTNSEITGTTTINTGGLTGTADSTKFGNNISLTNTNSDVSFVNGSSITGDLTATDGNNTIKFDNSSITGSVSQTGGNINFDLSNGSSIGTDLTFKNANAHFTGSGAGNSITGNFLSENTTLTGDVSGLTLAGTFTQDRGDSNITFRNESNFNDLVTITNANSSNINFENQSGIKANINVQNGTDNKLSLNNGSFITGDTTLIATTATITANDNSTITGNLTSENSTATVTLNASTFEGNITQNNNSLTLTGANGSTFTSNAFNITGNGNPATTNVNLNTGSNLSADITANNATLGFSLNNASSVGTGGAPSNIALTDSTLTITAQNGSTFNANITDTNNTNPLVTKTTTIDLQTGSTFNGTLDFTNIDVTASVNGSTFNSESIKAQNGKFDLSYTNSPNGGVITKFEATNTDLNIKADNSTAFINELTIKGNTLDLLAENNARLTIRNLELDNTKATYTAQTNGNLNVNTNLKDNASTLEVNLTGGMLQGTITQNKNGNAFNTGNVKLETVGDLGGRLAPTDDMQIKSLTLNNDEQILQSSALFASVFNNPMSYVDFTLEFDDTDTSSRVGKALILKPQPQPNQPIPPAPDGSTYVRQLQVDSIDGNHGLFRVYADLGANLADNILAQKASGDHIIQVQYRAATFSEAGGNDIVVAKVTDPTTSVSFKGTQSEVGLTRYDTEIIKRNANGGGFEWIIGQITQAGMSYSSKIIATLLQSQYRNFMVEVDSLDRRMGDLRYIKRDLGVWMRAYVGEATKAPNDFSVSSTDNYYSVWAGVDFNSIGLTVHNFAGMFFNYTGINSESKDFKGSGYNIGVGFYDTFKAFSGFYADFLIKYIYSSTSFDISNYALAKNKPEIDNHKFLLNAEVGYTFYYGEKFKSGYIEPQFQVTSGYIDQASLEVVDVSGEKIYATMARNFPITMRAGVFWGQVFGEKIKSHIKLGSSFAYDVNSGGDLHFQDSSTQLNFKQEGDFRMLLSAQTDFTFSDFFKLYASIDTSFFGDYNITYSANFGLRMTFGRANNRVANVPMVYNPYEPPVAINDDRRTVPVVKRFTTKDIDQNYVGKNRKVESQIRGNPTPKSTYGAPTYTPSRQSIRDITSEVSF